jgi:ribonuclease HII
MSEAAASAATLVAGVDEAGRGPLAGPVVCAAVILKPRHGLRGLDDSKALSEDEREHLFPRIVERALAWHVVFVDVADIDRLNIFHATMHGMRESLRVVAAALAAGAHAGCPIEARVDGNRLPRDLPCAARAIVGGDALDRAIMAASILAKVSRDRHMRELHARWPDYGFDAHKGYSTPAHLEALARLGPCPEHRRSFAPVREALQGPDLFAECEPAFAGA